MKKSKLSVGLVTGFIGAIALTACGQSVTYKDNAIISFTPFNGGEQVDIVTDEMYNEYKKGSLGVSDFYDKLLEVMVRYDFEKGGAVTKDDNKNTVAVIESEVKEEVEQEKQNARDKAVTNGTSYETEWQSILDSHGVKDEDGLFQHIKYEKELQRIEDWYLKYSTRDSSDKKATLLDEFIGVYSENSPTSGERRGTSVWKDANAAIAPSKFPYHISHILVSTSSSSFTSETISQDEAEKVVNVFRKLTGGHTFGEVAMLNSSDSSSSSYGDVDIMLNTATSDGSLPMYPEFQLGIYAFDGILSKGISSSLDGAKDVNDGLGISTLVIELSKELSSNSNDTIKGLTEVPANVFDDLMEYANVTAEPETGLSIANGDNQILPRNLIWNKYLNHKNAFIITNRNRLTFDEMAKRFTADPTLTISDVADELANPNILKGGYDSTVETVTGKFCGFRKVKDIPALASSAFADDVEVLTDENANPIICVRSSAGLHFISITKSIYDFANDDVSLRDYYYFDKTPADSDYPERLKGKTTYVNNLNNVSESDYTTRAEKIKSQVKSYDSSYTYRIFDYLKEIYKNSFTFEGSGQMIYDEINNFIDLKRESNLRTQKVGMEKAWKDYFKNIEQQNSLRKTNYVYSTDETEHVRYRIASEGCAIGFAVKGYSSDEAYKEGGACYYGK